MAFQAVQGSGTIRAGVLDIAYLDSGPSDGQPVILLHGFPYDVRSYDEVSTILAAEGLRCLVPFLRGYGATRFISPQVMRSGQQAALGADLLAFMDALGLRQAVLGGYDWGGRAACIVAALWPERVSGLVSCGQGYNIQDIANAWRPAPPSEETRYWYIYYFNTERGRQALLHRRHDLFRHIWSLWSPSWDQGGAYDETGPSFDNPDFVNIVLHSYRHRLGGVAGDPGLDAIEALLARQPDIAVPTIVLQGADDAVDPPTEGDRARKRFVSSYKRTILPGIGHNPPQEDPVAFALAVLSLSRREHQRFAGAD